MGVNCSSGNAEEEVTKGNENDGTIQIGMKQNLLTVDSVTWSRDSHGLFDYESKKILQNTHTLKANAKLLRQGNDTVLMLGLEEPMPSELAPLVKIRQDGNDWSIEASNEEQLWKVISPDSENKGYRMVEGDIVKLGRMKFKVKELRTEKQLLWKKVSKTPDTSGEFSAAEVAVESEDSVSRSCRICLGEHDETDNPLISPCQCAGTMEFIHFSCLRQWLTLDINPAATSNVTSYEWKSMDCEVCKTEYPATIKHKGTKFDLMEMKKPEHPYIILESVQRDRSARIGIYIISMENKNSVRLGRRADSDIRITDISVSRFHALIRYQDGQFYIEDNTSKFGTLVNIGEQYRFEEETQLTLQVGRTVLYCNYTKY